VPEVCQNARLIPRFPKKITKTGLRSTRAGSRALSSSIELYVIEVSLQAHPEPKLREQLQAIPTSFSLPHDEVDKLISAAQTILRSSDEFGRLLRDLAVH